MKMSQLSVSSAILAAVLSGCSQQQIIGGSQISGGSQQQVEAATPMVVPQAIQPRVVTPPPRIKSVIQPKHKTYVHKAKPRPTQSTRQGLGLPPAKLGQCFAKVKVYATYKTKSRRVLVAKATNKRVLVRAPQYRWLNKKVLVRKAMYNNRVIPAQYGTTVKRVMVKPAYNTWRKGHGAITRIDNMTGEIMCRVKVPAVYKNVSQRKLVRPAHTIRTLIPAVYKTVKQKKLIAPAVYKTIKSPARFKTQNYRVKVGGTRYVWKSVLCKTNAPKNYRKATKKIRKAVVKRKPMARTTSKKQYPKSAGLSYETYLKVMNSGSKKSTPQKINVRKTTKKTIKKAVKARNPAPVKKAQQKSKAETKKGIVYGIQKSLKEKGFDPGKIDGKMGPGTAAALKAFQSSHGLPVGQLTKDTFRALGLIR